MTVRPIAEMKSAGVVLREAIMKHRGCEQGRWVARSFVARTLQRWSPAASGALAVILGALSAQAGPPEPDPSRARDVVEEMVVIGTKESLTAPGVERAREVIQEIPGGVDLVAAEEFRSQRVATLKDVLDYVPGVYVQPKFGEDARFSIRGSGLSRNFHLRGVRLLVDGVPINTSDGSGDFQEIEPLSARYVEVYKGATLHARDPLARGPVPGQRRGQ
jgi:outer membrane receptor protein involved in Fe transport